MSLSRRRLFQPFGSATHGEWIAARGREAAVAEGSLAYPQQARAAGASSNVIRIASNENPVGPGQHVIDVIVGKFPEAGRYPFNAKEQEPVLVKTLATKYGVANDQIVLGPGSGEILTNAVRAFTSPSKPLALAWPTFENPRDTAKKIGTEVRAVDLDKNLRIDIDKLVDASKGAGLVFFCNPNNPTATVHPADHVADFVKRVRAASPDTMILIDEAYHDYVTDPAYKTAMDIAKTTPNVFVTRTFSKAYGMAGLRLGYAVGAKEAIQVLNRYRMPYAVNLPTIAAGLWVAGRGREAGLFDLDFEAAYAQMRTPADGPMILASNENPLGPGKAVLDAVRANFGELSRYQFATAAEVTELVAKKHNVKPENVLIGSGSTQILRSTTHIFCSKTAPLIAPMPAYEECAGYAALMGYPVRTVKLTPPPELKMDVAAILDAAKGGGMVFFCNPNNPVATAVDGKTTRDFITALGKSSPNTTTLVDEAYFEYATMPGYETMIPVAVENPRVVVARTFSKCYGMAGLRFGYAVGHRDSIKRLRDWDADGACNVLGLSAARAALTRGPEFAQAESKRNTEARAFTMKWFTDHGYTPTDSQANFIFVDIKRPAKAFREACAKQNVLVGRDFPPYEKSHCRISISTMEDMQKAVKVFEGALAAPAAAA